MDWFLYDIGLRRERVKGISQKYLETAPNGQFYGKIILGCLDWKIGFKIIKIIISIILI